MGHSSIGYGVPSLRVWCSSACRFSRVIRRDGRIRECAPPNDWRKGKCRRVAPTDRFGSGIEDEPDSRFAIAQSGFRLQPHRVVFRKGHFFLPRRKEETPGEAAFSLLLTRFRPNCWDTTLYTRSCLLVARESMVPFPAGRLIVIVPPRLAIVKILSERHSDCFSIPYTGIPSSILKMMASARAV